VWQPQLTQNFVGAQAKALIAENSKPNQKDCEKNQEAQKRAEASQKESLSKSGFNAIH
jgi:hypothetical protein